MSDFFSAINSGNIRTPDGLMNSGPLPSTNAPGGVPPQGGFGTSSRINYGSSLLGDISPYNYADGDRPANDTSFQNIPYRIGVIVPVVCLPGPNESEEWIYITHPVDQGDIAFVLRDMALKSMVDKKELERLYTEKNCNVYLNLAMVNYILMGIQLYIKGERTGNPDLKLPKSWATFLECIGVNAKKVANDTSGDLMSDMLRHILTNVIVPFGIPVGSEKQGGQHERVDSIVTWAVNYSTTMFVDGYVRSFVNLWINKDISAGDQLGFYLKKTTPTQNDIAFTLNHYPKAVVRKSFSSSIVNKFLNGTVSIFQLSPCIVNQMANKIIAKGLNVDTKSFIMWKVALAYTRMAAFPAKRNVERDDTENNRGALIEGVFCPCPMRQMFVKRDVSGLGLYLAMLSMEDVGRLSEDITRGLTVSTQTNVSSSNPVPHQTSLGMQRYNGLNLEPGVSSRPAAPVTALGSQSKATFAEKLWASSLKTSSSSKSPNSDAEYVRDTTRHVQGKLNENKDLVDAGMITAKDVLLHMRAMARNEALPEKTRNVISFATYSEPHHNPFFTSYGMDTNMEMGSGSTRRNGIGMREEDFVNQSLQNTEFGMNSIMGGEERSRARLSARPLVTRVGSDVDESGFMARQKRSTEGTDINTWLQGSDRGMKRYGQMSIEAERQRMDEALNKVAADNGSTNRDSLGVKSMFRAASPQVTVAEDTVPAKPTSSKSKKGGSKTTTAPDGQVQGAVIGEKEARKVNLF